VKGEFDSAEEFVEQTGLRVYLGEFRRSSTKPTRRHASTSFAWSAKKPTPAASGWCYWDDGAAQSARREDARTWVPYLKSALLAALPVEATDRDRASESDPASDRDSDCDCDRDRDRPLRPRLRLPD